MNCQTQEMSTAFIFAIIPINIAGPYTPHNYSQTFFFFLQQQVDMIAH